MLGINPKLMKVVLATYLEDSLVDAAPATQVPSSSNRVVCYEVFKVQGRRTVSLIVLLSKIFLEKFLTLRLPCVILAI